MRSKRLILTLVGLFVIVNISMIFFDDEDRVERRSNISEWTDIKSRYMEDVLSEYGMITADKQHVYFDEQRGEFEEFFVEKSDQVAVGDQLYSYKITDYAETRQKLNHEITRLEDEIDSLEGLISDMEFYNIPTNAGESSFSVNEGEYEIDIADVQNIESEYQKEQFIVELERDLAMREAKLGSVEDQLDELESTGETITVTSPYDGVVEEVSTDLDAPLVTILGQEKIAQAELTDEEQKQVEEGMQARVNHNVDGEVARVNDVPEKLDQHKLGRYSLNVGLNDQTDELLFGEKVDLDVILESAENASVVKQDHLYGDQLWVIAGDGQLTQVDVRTGIRMDEWVEIESMPPGIHYAFEPEERFRDQTPVTTLFDFDEMQWLDMFDFAKQNPILEGLLYR